MSEGIWAGIDLGSRQVKIAVMKGDRVSDRRLFETAPFYRDYARLVDGELAVDFAALGLSDLDGVVSTGYGRNNVRLKGARAIPELKAHAVGACYQTGLSDFILLDLGGQDSKVIKVQAGAMVDFVTNDKCAASSGRYLENMAAVLGITLEELASHHENPVDLDATCAVFGESELIGRISEGHPLANLAAGVNYTIFRRIRPMLVRFLPGSVVFTGGVARSPALRRIIEAELDIEVIVPADPQFNGAIGAAVLAGRK